MAEGIYLDNHATTALDPCVLSEMLPWFSDRYGNPASTSHAFGREAEEAVSTARAEIAACVGCEPGAIVFTSGATESDNLAIKGVCEGSRSQLITTAAEHRAVLDPVRRLRREGAEVSILPVDQYGAVDPAAVAQALRPETRLVSVMLANNEVGTLNPISEIAQICREKGVWCHCDASQAVGKMPLDLEELSVDLCSFTAHKFYGPKGVGALFVRRSSPRVTLRPLIDGGGHEGGLRSGTLPVPLIVGFAAALRLAVAEIDSESARLKSLRDRLQERICSGIAGVTVHGHPTRRLAGNLNLGFDGVDGDALMTEVSRLGLAVSSGSACTTADPEPSHVLRAMGVPDRLARASLRFGLGRFTTEDEIDRASAIVVEVVKRLREMRIA